MSPHTPIRKAVFPVAGLGTRFLPATKSTPKEMLPIVDKPLIQYAVEEALEAGIETLVFVTSRKKHSISDHFDIAFELETRLAKDGKTELLDKITNLIPEHVTRAHVSQPEALGLGHAVLCAAPVVGDEPFAVLLADDMIRTRGAGCLKQMVECYQQTGKSILGVEEVPMELTRKYGVVDIERSQHSYHSIQTIVEKPKPEEAPSNLGVVGRYILEPGVFQKLRDVRADATGEIQLTDAIAALLRDSEVLAYEFDGVRYDCGSRLGFIKATLDYALEHDDLKEDILKHVAEALNENI